MGPTDIQGTQKVFDVKTGANKKWCTICNMPMPQAIITRVHNWENFSAREAHLGEIVFLNRNKKSMIGTMRISVTLLISLRITPPYITIFQRIYLELILNPIPATHGFCLLQLRSLTLNACKL